MNPKIRKIYNQRDRVVKALTENGRFRMAVVRNTNAAREAQKRHKLSPLAAVFLGKTMAGASLLSSFLTSEERIIIEINGSGVLGKVFAEALQLGEVRGYVANPQASLNFGSPATTLSDACGIGLFKVARILYGNYAPVEGVVELIEGDISTDLAYYLLQSEQIPSAVVLDVSVNEEGQIEQSGGIIVQALPGASEQQIRALYDSLQDLDRLPELFFNGYSVEEVLQMSAVEPLIEISETPIDFFCRCSLERFKSTLITLGMDEIREMQAQEQRELVCRYCNNHYYLQDADFQELLAKLQAKNN